MLTPITVAHYKYKIILSLLFKCSLTQQLTSRDRGSAHLDMVYVFLRRANSLVAIEFPDRNPALKLIHNHNCNAERNTFI